MIFKEIPETLWTYIPALLFFLLTLYLITSDLNVRDY